MPEPFDNAAPEPTPEAAGAPAPLVVAAALVALEGVVLILLAAAELSDLTDGRRSMGASIAVFFAGYGAILVVAAVGLWRCSSWARGPGLLTQLIALGLAWNIRDESGLGTAVLVITAVIALAAMIHPASIEALGGAPVPGDED